MKHLAEKLIGVHIPDRQPKPGLSRFLQEQCRQGTLKAAIEEFTQSQPESLEPGKVVVEGYTEKCIQCSIPCAEFDHEDTSPVHTEVEFEIDLVTGKAVRTGY